MKIQQKRSYHLCYSVFYTEPSLDVGGVTILHNGQKEEIGYFDNRIGNLTFMGTLIETKRGNKGCSRHQPGFRRTSLKRG